MKPKGHVEKFSKILLDFKKLSQIEIIMTSEPSELPELTKMKARNFKDVTQTKDRLVKSIKGATSDEAVVELMLTEFPKALEEYSSIFFEVAGLESKIQASDDFSFLKNLDFAAFLSGDRLLDTQVKEARFLSLMEDCKKSNKMMIDQLQKLSTGSKAEIPEKVSAVLIRLEAVRTFFP